MTASHTSNEQPVVPSPLLTLARALPALAALGVACLVPLWGAGSLDWSVFALVFAYIIQTLASGVLARRRARHALGPTSRPKDDVLVKEFFKTYVSVVLASALIASMVFSGRLYMPDAGLPVGVYAALATWQYWVVVAVLVAGEVAVYAWDHFRGLARSLPPETFVTESLRRLFVLQGAALILGFIVFWRGSTPEDLAFIVVAWTTCVVVMAALARLREARVRAALDAGIEVKTVAEAVKARPHAGRRRRRH